MRMIELLTAPPDIELGDSAAHALKKLSQRSTYDLTLLKLIYTKVMKTLEYKTSFFLPISASPYDPVPKTRTAILQDTGALLTMPEDFAHLQWKKVETLSTRLAAQHPDHATNIIRLWQATINIAGWKKQDTILKDLGLLFQHRDDEVVVMMGILGVSAGPFKVEDEEMVVIQDEDEDGWETKVE
ncbi:hypothetical protein E8E11_007790 [Didymella keratinophila]|nr:hypothetical protein E8E11_007790 [Didymella keratinophila]